MWCGIRSGRRTGCPTRRSSPWECCNFLSQIPNFLPQHRDAETQRIQTLWIASTWAPSAEQTGKAFQKQEMLNSGFLFFEMPFLSAWPAKQATQVEVSSLRLRVFVLRHASF